MTLALPLLLLLALETVLWVWLGHNLFQSSGSWLQAIGVPVLLALLWRAVFVALGFAVSGVWRHAAAGNRRQRLGAWRGEWWWQLRLYTWLQPLLGFEALNRDPDGGATHQPPVLLVHGFLCNAGLWRPFRRGLRRRGIGRIHTLNLDPLYRDMQVSLERLHAKVEALLRHYGCDQVVLVGHSMGGVLVRLYRARHPRQVAAACCLAAPHHGTLGARWVGYGRERGPPSPHSVWLAQFNAEQTLDADLLNIWTEADNIVWPQHSAQLETARELKLQGYGHLHLLAAPAVLDAVVAQIEAVTPVTPPSRADV